MKWISLALFAILVPGGIVIALTVWLRRCQRGRADAALDRTLVTHRQALAAKRQGQALDESLQAKARVRREIADSMRKRSALVASGSSSASVLKMVKKA